MSETLYQALIMERSKTPRFAGRPERFAARGQGDNPLCGDRTEVFVQLDGAVAHASRGCAIMTASADLMAEAVAGKSPQQIAEISRQFGEVVTSGAENPALGQLNALAGVAQFRSRIGCATLPWTALAAALTEVQQNG